MDNQALILLVSFVTMLLLNMPVAVAIALSTLLTMLSLGEANVSATTMVANKIATGINQNALLAIPFFVLSGLLMGRGGMARRLINFSDAIMGRMPGGLSYVNTLTCMMFGSISGSAAAAVSSIGGFMIPEMEKKGYPREFSVAVTATAATTGLLIPPSNVMIIYATVTGVSVGAMFMAGVLPGILTGLCIMAACAFLSIRHGYGRKEANGRHIPSVPKAPKEIIVSLAMILIGMMGLWMLWFRPTGPLGLTTTGHVTNRLFLTIAYFILMMRGSFRLKPIQTICFLQALPSLMLIVIVIGGILTGKFSATEASAVAVLYSFLLAVCAYREIKWKQIAKLLLDAGATTAVVMLLIGASQAMGWILTRQNIPQSIATSLMNVSSNPIVILLIINAILLLVGTFMDMTPAILIFTPIFLPVVTSPAIGLTEVHFGIMLIANLCIGLCTPPVGTCLFIGCGIGKTTIAKTTRPMIPFFIAMILALMAITFIPALSTWLPQLTGQLK
ncbi:MAG: TRAP transporter large permease [Phycisphaerales bacterium]|nr:TRAP transporter large permease [Phycisphaerales bacterium]MBT7171636.1 TRAP transporter large permease [Phycisphaerales bacterium]